MPSTPSVSFVPAALMEVDSNSHSPGDRDRATTALMSQYLLDEDEAENTNTSAENPPSPAGPPRANKRRTLTSSASKSQKRSSKSLACLSCRPRKIKCERVGGTCERCRSLHIPCSLPDRDERRVRYSKDYIINLENQIAELKAAVATMQKQHQHQQQHHSPSQSPSQLRPPSLGQPSSPPRSPIHLLPVSQPQTQASPAPRPPGSDFIGSPSMSMRTDDSSAIAAKSTQATTTTELESSESLITRLCGAQGRLNSKHDGQLRYFGPTSSLHLTESVNSIFRYCSDIQRFGAGFEKDVPWAMQQYLLDLYWRYQHDILHIVHKQAFLAGMEATHSPSPYFSRCLLLCILASAARSSASPEIRALTLPAEEDTGESPILMKQAEEALQEELLNPGLTTVQSLMLLSILDCCQSNDSRGWMRSGQACRLAFDLGLHQNWSHLPQSKLPSFEMEVRRVIFWGCVGFDRLWALYLGRPPVIKLSDVSIPRPDRNASSWEMKMFAAWVELLDLAGQISEKLNTNTCFQEQIDFYMDALQSWDSSCDHSITFFPNAPPGVYLLRIQYSALVILLNRHNAGYGNLQKRNCAHSQKSRKACVEHALITSQLLQDYAAHHGSANTMMGSVLYNITSAATIVVAEMAEKNRRDVPKESAALAICLNAMKEMESAEIVARNVRKIVQTIMRVCNVQNNYSYDDGNAGAGAGAGPVTGFWAKDYNPSNEDGPSHAGVDEATTADANKENDRNNTNTNTNTNTNNNNNNTATTTTTNATTTTINDAMSLNFGPLGFDSVFQFPFEEVLLDPMSANEFMQQ